MNNKVIAMLIKEAFKELRDLDLEFLVGDHTKLTNDELYRVLQDLGWGDLENACFQVGYIYGLKDLKRSLKI